MDVKLLVVGGKNSGRPIPVQGPKFFIGRSEECQLRPGSDLVSRHHCVILQEEGYVAVRDFGSKNGTYVNGERVSGERELKTGDRLKVGPLEFDIQLEVNLSGKKKPKVHNVQEAAQRTVETAKTAAPDKDIDISDWIAGDDTVAGTAPETVALPPAETPKPEPTKAHEAGKPDPLAGPHVAKPKAVNSRAAADDVLRQFFRRR